MQLSHHRFQCKNVMEFITKMKRSSPEPRSRDESLVTPTVYHEERLLSPPPAPVGCVYDDRDALTSTGAEERQTSSSREAQNIPILEFPSIPNIPHQSFNFTRHERRGDTFTLSPSQSRQESIPRGRRRSNSFNGTTPFPSISLRPRFSRSGLHRSPFHEPSRQAASQRYDHDGECECRCLDCRRDLVVEGPSHIRSHTYNCDSTVFADAFDDAFDDAFAQETLSRTPPPLPTLSGEMDISSLKSVLPPISPPKSTFRGPPSTFDDCKISRPVPRKISQRTRITQQSIPDGDNRLSLGNASEGNTICTTLSSSNNSAFGTPTREKITSSISSPLTSGSDSASPEASRNRESQGVTQLKGMPAVRGFPPTFSQCKSSEKPPQMTLLVPKNNIKTCNGDLPFDEAGLHQALHHSLNQGKIHKRETSNEDESKH